MSSPPISKLWQGSIPITKPGETKSWSQYWYPIQRIGPAQCANLDAAVNLRLDKKNVYIGVCVTRAFPRAVIRLERNGSAAEWNVDLKPGDPCIMEMPQPRTPWKVGKTILRVIDRNGSEIISYQPKARVKGQVPPPATEPPVPTRIASADELFITGLHLDQYRHATRCPTLYWREALRRDPLDSRCNNALGLWNLRRGEFAQAEAHFRKAIERLTRRNGNPHDGEAFYNLGLCLRYLNRDEDAYAAFYKATWNQAWAGVSYHALAEIDCVRGAWNTALGHLNRSLRFDTDDLRARNLKVLVLRKLEQTGEATVLLRETLRLDPLDGWARHLVGEKITCDLQTQLDIAHDYAGAGFYAEAIELLSAIDAEEVGRVCPQRAVTINDAGCVFARTAVLSRSKPGALGTDAPHLPAVQDASARILHSLPTQDLGALPLLHYTLGWLEQRRGNDKVASKHFHQAARLSPDYCFPSRLEEIAILEAAMRANPRDARTPYYLGNLLYPCGLRSGISRQPERCASLIRARSALETAPREARTSIARAYPAA